MTAIETREAPELNLPQNNLEILTPKRYAVAGRLLAASVATPTELASVLNPAIDVKTTIMPGLVTKLETPGATRNISQITHTLSTAEREAEWHDRDDLDAALTEWIRGFTTYATSTTKEGRKAVIGGLAGKDAVDLTETDSHALYDRFCKTESNTSEFVGATIGRLKGTDGKVDIARLQAEIDDIQWLASRFFGIETAKAVAELIKVEAELTNNRENTINILLKDSTTSRLDSLYPEEAELLRKLLGEPIITADTTRTTPAAATATPASAPEPAAPPLPPTAWPTPASATGSPTTAPAAPPPPATEAIAYPRASQILQELDDIRSGKPIVDPATHETRTGSNLEDYANDLRRELTTLITPPDPETTPQVIDEARLQEAKDSEQGKKINRILDRFKLISERAHNAEPEDTDEEERRHLITELENAIGNKSLVTDALEKINRLYKSLSEGQRTPAYKANKEEFLQNNPDIKDLDEDAVQEEAKLYLAVYQEEELPTWPPVTPPPASQAPTAAATSITTSGTQPTEQPTPASAPEPVSAMPTGGTEPEPIPEPEDASEPAVAPPSRVRTQQEVLSDIAEQAIPKRELEPAEQQLAHIEEDIRKIKEGTFRGPDGRELPPNILETYLQSLEDQRAEIRLHLAADNPLFAQQDNQTAEERQPVPGEDTQHEVITQEQPEESLAPLPGAPEPGPFVGQDATVAAEPEQPAVAQESEQPEPAGNTGIVGGLLRRLMPKDTAA